MVNVRKSLSIRNLMFHFLDYSLNKRLFYCYVYQIIFFSDSNWDKFNLFKRRLVKSELSLL